MNVIDISGGLTSEKIKVNDYLYGCICNTHSAQMIAILWNGDFVVNNDRVIIAQSEDGSVKLVCVIDDSLEGVYKLV